MPLTASVTRKWAGVDSVWKWEKLEAAQKAKKRAESHLSGARIVGRRLGNELDSYEHDSGKQLRQHGFESSEKPCAASADELATTSSRKHTLCTHRVCGRTGAILHDPQTDPTVFLSPPN